MEPIEINAGTWYLRALRADERVDDRPALRDGGIDDPAYVTERTRQWAADEHYSWAVCEPTTGELLAEVGLTPDGSDGVLSGWARRGHDDALATATDSVRRFAEGALGLALAER
ncbi:hypothetical protein [Prescottella agglutinans]|uniref:GNAT family N-acetyltransferase n=1 Tax=Prescottella agglutinans TaxID=1644129 RepID=A0ABT6M517_9NOCA|nr:hypothetical protein [Prescottella agglutinans]MDH6279408.1 hypothetical protein [Prescottella agglutinans]